MHCLNAFFFSYIHLFHVASHIVIALPTIAKAMVVTLFILRGVKEKKNIANTLFFYLVGTDNQNAK